MVAYIVYVRFMCWNESYFHKYASLENKFFHCNAKILAKWCDFSRHSHKNHCSAPAFLLDKLIQMSENMPLANCRPFLARMHVPQPWSHSQSRCQEMKLARIIQATIIPKCLAVRFCQLYEMKFAGMGCGSQGLQKKLNH